MLKKSTANIRKSDRNVEWKSLRNERIMRLTFWEFLFVKMTILTLVDC